MKTIIFTLAVLVFNLTSIVTKAQSYTTESKSCGACHKEVSISSHSGMSCPHCGARWGSENTTRTTKNTTSYDYNAYNSYNTFYSKAEALSKCNVRSYPSTNAEILGTAKTFQTFDVIEVDNNWVKVKVSYYDSNYNNISSYGWIHKSLVSLF